MILLESLVAHKTVNEFSADRQCGLRSLSKRTRTEVDGTVLATYPCTNYEVGAYGHEPCIGVIVGSTCLASPVCIVEDVMAERLTCAAGFVHSTLQHLLHEESRPVRQCLAVVFRCDIDLVAIFVKDACDDDRVMVLSVIGYGTVGIYHFQQVHVAGAESQ